MLAGEKNQAVAGQVIRAEGFRPQEGKAETRKGEALLDYPVRQLEDAPAASGEQLCAGLQHSTGVALALGAEKGKRVEHPLDGGSEMQRAHSREGQVVFCLMLDTFLLLTAADLALDLSYPEQSLIPNAAFQQGLSSLADLGVWSPGSTWGGQDSSSNSFVSNYSLTSACLLACNRRNSTAHAEVIRQHLSNSLYTGNYWPFHLEAEGGDSTEKDSG